MSKRFKGKTCVYCGLRPSMTGDHVFARQFFAVDKRGNLPQVPACVECNGKKSELEHYLTTMLLIGGRHLDAQSMIVENLPRRLAKNEKLHRSLAEGMRVTSIDEPPPKPGFIPVQFRFEGQKLHDLFSYVARGLRWHHWRVIADAEDIVRVVSLTRSGEGFFESLLRTYARRRVSANLGNGTFVYDGAQGDYPGFTLWSFYAFGGIRLHGESNAVASASRYLAAITGRPDLLANADFMKLLYLPPQVHPG
jgi:hypothetical protein